MKSPRNLQGNRAVGLIAVIFLLAALHATPAGAMETILRFQSLVEVGADGSLEVVETIRVRAEGQSIKRGIYRLFPTDYRSRWGLRVTVPFVVKEVLRDGVPEAWHSERASGGVKVYIGKKSVLLDPGEYTYTLRYVTDRQIGYFDDYDELYWNVTGNDWAFPVERAEAEIRLPPGGRALKLAAYTGSKGEKGRDWTASGEGAGAVRFATTRTLHRGEGLTVAVSWPKGLVRQPDGSEEGRAFLSDNAPAVIAMGGCAVLLFYYLITWMLVGKDPPRGVLVPEFEPPEGYSPGATRFIMNLGYDNRAFAATVVDMAVRGYLTIAKKRLFTLQKTGASEEKLSKGQKKVARALFSGGGSIELSPANHAKMRKAIEGLKKSLRREFQEQHFRLNRSYLLPGAAITVVTIAGAALFAGAAAEAAFLTTWLSVWTMGCWGLFTTVFRAWREVRAGGGIEGVMRVAGALFVTAFSIPFFAGEIGAFVMLAGKITLPAAAGIVASLLSSLFFSHLLKAPTLFGRRAMDRIEGFRMYLEAAEKDRLERMNPPEKTPELFERYLPYALALDVENSWSERFAGVLADAGGGREYRPEWYSDSRGWSAFDAGRLSSALGSSLTSAVSSASRAPGSSSGSSGGGSSGGGGGGGGGGGW